MRGLWRLGLALSMVLGLFAALPAMAAERTCEVEFSAGDYRLSISSTGDASGAPVSEFDYILVLLDRDPATPYWISANLVPGTAPGSGTLNLTLTLDEGGNRRYRWRVSGASGDYEIVSGREARLDWAMLNARFAGDTKVRVSVSPEAAGAAPLSAGTMRLDDLRLAEGSDFQRDRIGRGDEARRAEL